jgi:hypothetical protein
MCFGNLKPPKPRGGSITGYFKPTSMISQPTIGDVSTLLRLIVPSLIVIAVFRVLINLGLRLVGAEYSQQAMEDELSFMESFYASHVGLHPPACFIADAIGLPLRRAE